MFRFRLLKVFVSRTTKTLVPKERGVEGFVVAAKLAIELGVAMEQSGKVSR